MIFEYIHSIFFSLNPSELTEEEADTFLENSGQSSSSADSRLEECANWFRSFSDTLKDLEEVESRIQKQNEEAKVTELIPDDDEEDEVFSHYYRYP